MERYVNGTTTDPASDGKSNSGDEVGPLSILPIVVSLFAVVAIAIAACVFYRKRQRERAQLLARQLRVTERRIDAVGSLRGRKEKDSGKTVYYPPTDVRASASEPSIVSRPIPGIRPHYVIRAYQPQLVPIHSKLQTRTSLINSSACSCDYVAETSFCSTCKEKDDKKAARKDTSAGSLAVELATVPSIGSLSAIQTPSKSGQQDDPLRKQEIRRTRSDTAGVSSQNTHNISILAGIMNKVGEITTPSRGVLEWMEKSKTQHNIDIHTHTQPPPTTSLDTHLPSSYPGAEGSQYMSTTTNEQEPPPNTPVSQSIATSINEGATATDKHALSYISEDTQSEKWV